MKPLVKHSQRPLQHFLRNFRPILLILISVCCGCSDDDEDAKLPPATASSDQIVIVPFFIADDQGNTPTDPDTPLFERRGQQPIMAPDGHQITLKEFSTATGNISVACMEEGTKVTLNLKGLIPNGVYTIWNVTFKAPGLDPTVADFNQIGQGAIGPTNGTDSDFIASAEGDGQISATTPAGQLSMFGNIAACPLTEEVEWHVVGAYHIDGKTHGPSLGPDGTAVEQFGFVFKQKKN